MSTNNAVMNPLVKQLVGALQLARGYMSDAVEYEMPCAKKDAATVDDAIAAALAAKSPSAQLVAQTPRLVRFRISYRDAAYRVSIPMYEGGEVVNAEAYDALAEQRAELLEALKGIMHYAGMGASVCDVYTKEEPAFIAAYAAIAKCGVKP